MAIERQVLHHLLDTAKDYLKNNNPDLARDHADMGLAYIAGKRREGYEATDKIEDIRLELWLERFWLFLEKNNLMLG
jgi:hypothetical protein